MDLSTGKKNEITITNAKDRLSKEEIERMTKDAEKYKSDDDKHRTRIFYKTKLKQFIFDREANVEDEKIRDKISKTDRKNIMAKFNETIKWVDDNQVRLNL